MAVLPVKTMEYVWMSWVDTDVSAQLTSLESTVQSQVVLLSVQFQYQYSEVLHNGS